MDPEKRLLTTTTAQRKHRRPRKEISNALSSEARLAMSQVQEEIKVSDENHSGAPVECYKSPVTVDPSTGVGVQDEVMTTKGTFNEVYERLDILRLEGDITVTTETPQSFPTKRCIGGGKLFNAMEVVETVIFGQDICEKEIDDIGKEDTARLISLEKCRVWFDAQKDHFLVPSGLHTPQSHLKSSSLV